MIIRLGMLDQVILFFFFLKKIRNIWQTVSIALVFVMIFTNLPVLGGIEALQRPRWKEMECMKN